MLVTSKFSRNHSGHYSAYQFSQLIFFVYLILGVVARPSTSLDFSEINKAKTMQTQVSS